MSHPDDQLAGYRDYLGLLARHDVSPRVRTAIDLSGVIQQTLLDAHKAPPRDRNPAETAGWLRSIFRHNLADELRRRDARKRAGDRVRPIDEVVDPPAAGHTSPSQRAIRAEELMRLAVALSGLPESQRRAVELHHLQGLPLAEIAEALDTTKPAVAGLLHRGLKALRARLTSDDMNTASGPSSEDRTHGGRPA